MPSMMFEQVKAVSLAMPASVAWLLFLVSFALLLFGFMVGWSYGRHQRFAIKKSTGLVPASMPWHLLSINHALEALKSHHKLGLSDAEANKRLLMVGPNRLQTQGQKSLLTLFAAQFKSLLILILIIAALVAAMIGDIKDGLVIVVVVLINALLGFYQEFQAEHSLASLKKMLELKAKLRRDGQIQQVAAECLVPGDIILVEAGDKLPADGRILTEQTLEVDESSLTGESLPVAKQSAVLATVTLPLAERSNMVYMNTTVTAGHAEILVTATGDDTEIGCLARLLAQAEESDTPLQQQLDHLAKRLAIVALLVASTLFGFALFQGKPWMNTAFTAIALAVAAIPEGLPAVVTVTLALGMHRMAKQKAIIKRMAAVETLGCTTVICTDKTGTLTVNQMTVRQFYYHAKHFHVTGEGYLAQGEIHCDEASSEDLSALIRPLCLCNNSHWTNNQFMGDPLEAALLVLAKKAGMNDGSLTNDWLRLAEIPFSASNKLMATFHKDSSGQTLRISVKGAPEVILKRCTQALGEIDFNRTRLLNENTAMAATGQRVIAVAERVLALNNDELECDLFDYLTELTFVGLISLIDPPRAEASLAIKRCHQAGIAVKMITGDQKVTAMAIAKELGLHGDVLEGHELTLMDDDTLAACINAITVFARTAPEQKVRIVNALKQEGHIVAMTGDGVNDAAALKTADIGIAMGQIGTDVAKEAAVMILTDDNFATITRAIQQGRGIYENMVKFVRFQLATNIGAMLTVAGAAVLGLPEPFTAVQLLWINIIMDGPPAMSLALDPQRESSMNEAPRAPKSTILSWPRFSNICWLGTLMAIGTLSLLAIDAQHAKLSHATTLAFTTFVLFQVINVFNARTEHRTTFNRYFFRNKTLWFALIGVVMMQITVVHWPEAQTLFHTQRLSLQDWGLACAIASSILVIEELRKLLIRSYRVLRK